MPTAAPAVAVLDDPAAALAALDPKRAEILAALATESASATTLATKLGLPRQKVTYHLTTLADHGLVVEVDQRRHGGLTERIFAASASTYVVSPTAMGSAGADPARIDDRLSASYLLALAGRAIREVGQLVAKARRADKRLPIFTIDTDVRFASAESRADFATKVSEIVLTLAAVYHDDSAPGGRWYRVVAFSHPKEQRS